MKPIEQFIHEFLDEDLRFRRKYFDGSCIRAADKSITCIESATSYDHFAVVVLRNNYDTLYTRTRYQLEPFGDTWRIIDMKLQCSRCKGTGRKSEKGEPCTRCNGEIWI